MTKIKLAAAVITLSALCAAVALAQEKKTIEMVHVKYDGLKQEVLKHRGKVVVLDFWATWCPNCRKVFPEFVEMQQKYADKGLVVISVSLDSAEKEDAVEAANRFLTKNNSTLRNLLLDEPSDVWDKKLGIKSLPAYFIFDRHGKWVRYRASDYKEGEDYYVDLRKTVVQMLDSK